VPEAAIELFRAVSPFELTDIMTTGEFRPGSPSFQGKWFAESPTDAAEWGRRLYGAQPFHLVVVDVPRAVADSLFVLPNLDGIGPARFAEIDDLPALNATKLGPIREILIP